MRRTIYTDERADWSELYKDLNVLFKQQIATMSLEEAVRKTRERVVGFFNFSPSEAAERLSVVVDMIRREVTISIKPESGGIVLASTALAEQVRYGVRISIKF